MTDKSFGDHSSRGVVKNPLLSSAVVGVSLEDLTHNAVLLPVSLNPGHQGQDKAGTQNTSLQHSEPTLCQSSGDTQYLNPKRAHIQENKKNNNPTTVYDSTHSRNPISTTETVSEASEVSKASDDFNVADYIARLQGTRYVSAPMSQQLIDPIENIPLQPEESLEEVNLNETDEVQHSLTSDIAQNFSQLPQVLPQVASAVFSSFSNMLSYKSREQTPEATTSNVGERPSHESSVSVYNTVQFDTHVHDESVVEPVKQVGPPPKDPPVGNPTTSYRITTKKKAYAQIPGLSSHLGSQQLFNPPMPPQPQHNYFTPIAQPTDYSISQQTPQANNNQAGINISSFTTSDIANNNSTQPSVIATPSLYNDASTLSQITLETTNPPMQAPPIIPPPTMFSNQTKESVNVKSVLPPSVARRLSSNQPIMQNSAVPSFEAKYFVPASVETIYTQNRDIEMHQSTIESTSFQAAGLNRQSNIFNPFDDNAAALHNLPKVAYTETTSDQSNIGVPKFSTKSDASEAEATIPTFYNPTNMNQATNIPAPPQMVPLPASPQMAPLPAPPQMAPLPAPPQMVPLPHPPQMSPLPAPQMAPLPAPPQIVPLPDPPQMSPLPAPQMAPLPSPPQMAPLSAPPQMAPLPAPQIAPLSASPQIAPLPAPQIAPLSAPPQMAPGNFRLQKKRPQYYAGPIEGVGAISNNVKPIIEPVFAGNYQGALYTPQAVESQEAHQENANINASYSNPGHASTASLPFDINQQHASTNLGYQMNTQKQSTAFDFGSNDTNETPKDNKGFGLIGSLKSKLGSLDINKIQNTVTTFFDPAYNDIKLEKKNDQTESYHSHDYNQSAFNIYVPSQGTSNYDNPTFSARENYHNTGITTSNYSEPSHNQYQPNYDSPASYYYQNQFQQGYAQNFTTQADQTTIGTQEQLSSSNNMFQYSAPQQQTVGTTTNINNPFEYQHLSKPDDTFNSFSSPVHQTQENIQQSIEGNNVNSIQTFDIAEKTIGSIKQDNNQAYDKGKVNESHHEFKYNDSFHPPKVSLFGSDIQNADETVKIEANVFGSPIHKHSTDKTCMKKCTSTTELNICETCREVNVHGQEKPIEDLTAKLIENITSQVILANPVEVPLPESTIEDMVIFDPQQCAEITHVAEETLETLHMKSATEMLDEKVIEDFENNLKNKTVKDYGWSYDKPSSNISKEGFAGSFAFDPNPNSIGFFGNHTSRFFDKMPTNASDEIKANLINVQDDESKLIKTEKLIPTAPLEENIEITDAILPDLSFTESNESNVLDVNSIELDAKKDSPVYDEYVIEPSETDDDKIIERRRSTEEKELDTFTNRVDKFKEIAKTDVITPEFQLFGSQSPISPPLTIASYFDTGNYAVETHYKNSLTSPISINEFTQLQDSPRILEKSNDDFPDFKTVPDCSTQTKPTLTLTQADCLSTHNYSENQAQVKAVTTVAYSVIHSVVTSTAPSSFNKNIDNENYDKQMPLEMEEDNISQFSSLLSDRLGQLDNEFAKTRDEITSTQAKEDYFSQEKADDCEKLSQKIWNESDHPQISLDKFVANVVSPNLDVLDTSFLGCEQQKGKFGNIGQSKDQPEFALFPPNTASVLENLAVLTKRRNSLTKSKVQPTQTDAPDTFVLSSDEIQEKEVDIFKKPLLETATMQTSSLYDASELGLVKNEPFSEIKNDNHRFAPDTSIITYSGTFFGRDERLILSSESPSARLSPKLGMREDFETSGSESQVEEEALKPEYSTHMSKLIQVTTSDAVKSFADPVAFFTSPPTQNHNAESSNRLASYFATPTESTQKSFFELGQSQNHLKDQQKESPSFFPNESLKKPFFELSQSQNHYMDSKQHDPNVALMKNLTEFNSNNFVPNDEVVKHVNYFSVELDNPSIIRETINKQDVKKTISNPKIEPGTPKTIFNSNIEHTELTDEIKQLIIKDCNLCTEYCSKNVMKIFNVDTCKYNNRMFKFDVKKSMDNSEAAGSPREVADKVLTEQAMEQREPAVNSDTEDEKHNNVINSTETRQLLDYTPVKHHWFYRVDFEGKSVWRGFSIADSQAIEAAYNSSELTTNTLVPTDGGRYDVNVQGRLRISVYWHDKPSNVRRCSWFYKGTTDARYVPYTESVAEKLEEEYQHGVRTGEWHRRLVLPHNEVVVMHGPTVMVHLQTNTDAWAGNTFFTFSKSVFRNPVKIRVKGDEVEKIDHLILMVHGAGEYRSHKEKCQATMRPRVVRRGHEETEIEDPEPSKIDHLLLLCHGVGSACDMRFRSVEEVVDDFRSTSHHLIQAHYKNSYEKGTVGRIEVLPISWHETLHSGESGVDRRLEQITLDSIPRLRNFTNDTVLDVLFYTSPVFCQIIVNTVGAELNRIISLFRSRNPHFEGQVSLGGHSLGSVILYDLLCNQPTMNKEHIANGKVMSPGTSSVRNAGIKYPVLGFSPAALYALGSPIAIFECIRGVELLGENFSLPTCNKFFNIFHPYDPIAYRLEPLINPDLKKLPPLLIPHHKGRKRMHLELKDTMARVGADIKQRVVESIKATWSSMWRTQPPTSEQLEKVVEEEMEKEVLNKDPPPKETQPCYDPNLSSKLGRLNCGRRVDYVLQEAPFEMINEYLFAMSSHVCYWESEDTMLLILKEIYDSLDIHPDSTVPQNGMTLQRNRAASEQEVFEANIAECKPSTSAEPPK